MGIGGRASKTTTRNKTYATTRNCRHEVSCPLQPNEGFPEKLHGQGHAQESQARLQEVDKHYRKYLTNIVNGVVVSRLWNVGEPLSHCIPASELTFHNGGVVGSNLWS